MSRVRTPLIALLVALALLSCTDLSMKGIIDRMLGVYGTVDAPTFDHLTGRYPTAQTVTVSTATPGASIRYATDGSIPTSTTGTVSAGPISVAASETLNAIASKAGWTDSTVASATYFIAGPPKYAFVANWYDWTISAYSIGSNGAFTQLTSLGSPFSTGAHPQQCTITPNGSFLYVADSFGGGSISAYSIGSNGALTELTGSPFPAGSTPYGVTVSPNGSFLYVTNYGGASVSAFSIAANGALTAVSGSPFGSGTNPQALAVSPNGSFLYVADDGSATANVSAYSIGSDGALTELTSLGSPFTAGSNPYGLAVSPNGSFLYVANQNGDNVSAFSIGSNGALTELTSLGSPFNIVGPGTNPYGVAFSPNGSFLYVANHSFGTGSSTVSAYSIGSNGALTELTGSPFTVGLTGEAPTEIAISPNGSFLYVTNDLGAAGLNVRGYSIGSNGALTALTGSPYGAGAIPVGVAVK